MGAFGDLFFVRHNKNDILAFAADQVAYAALMVIAVTPRRGPLDGVNPVLITGKGFYEGVKIFFGGKECLAYNARTEESVWCQVPPGKPGEIVDVIAKRDGYSSKPSGHGEYEYMDY